MPVHVSVVIDLIRRTNIFDLDNFVYSSWAFFSTFSKEIISGVPKESLYCFSDSIS